MTEYIVELGSEMRLAPKFWKSYVDSFEVAAGPELSAKVRTTLESEWNARLAERSPYVIGFGKPPEFVLYFADEASYLEFLLYWDT